MANKTNQELTDEAIHRILEGILSKDSISKEDAIMVLRIEDLLEKRNKAKAEEARATEAAKKAETEKEKLKLEREKFETESKLNREKFEAEKNLESDKINVERERFEASSSIEKEKLDIERDKISVEKDKLRQTEAIEERKAHLESEKILAAKRQFDLETEKLEKEYKANLLKTGASIGTSVLGVLAFATMFYDGLEFEKNDVITSSFLSNVTKGISTKFIKID